METLNYVRRKSDGQYVSVDGGFTDNRRGKAFVFHEGAAMGITPFLTPEYDLVPLTEQETEWFSRFANSWDDIDFCHEHGCYFVECGRLGHGEDYDPDEAL